MYLSRLREYVIFKMTIGKEKNWDLWQFGIRSHLFKNQLRKERKSERNNRWIV